MSTSKSKNLPKTEGAEPYYFLVEDLDYLKQEVKEIENRVQAARQDAALSVSQAPGDGWHDNYGYEQARRDQLTSAGRVAELKAVLNRAVVIKPSDKIAKKLAIGKVFKYRIGNSKATQVTIGSWLTRPGQPGVISYNSPLAIVLRKSKKGEPIKFEISGAVKKLALVEH